MSPDPRLPIVLCWHMHQPDYRDLRSDVFTHPWTYLHAIKDYTDMAAHLEDCPAARAVVNFTPVLVEQLEAYERRLAAALDDGTPIGDPMLDALVSRTLPEEGTAREALLRACLRINKPNLVDRDPAFRVLYELAENATRHGRAARWFSDEFLFDLLTWYHLGWLGASVRRRSDTARHLIARGGAYTQTERRDLARVVLECLATLPGRYRALAEAGRIEIATSPWGHPILPLMLDFASAREALPDLQLPHSAHYPGGAERVRWHLAASAPVIDRYFGIRPAGCWPSEGALSQAALAAIADAGFTWAATGQNVLNATLARVGAATGVHRMYRDPRSGLALFARDDGLSDRIGFVYAGWDAHDAVSDFERLLGGVADAVRGEPALVAIIMDGENAWEHYPDNAWRFLSLLYHRLSAHERFRLTTFAAAAEEVASMDLPPLVAGSWVYGNLATWVGEHAKNRLWDHLVDGKRCYDAVLAEAGRAPSGAAQQLAVCEGSDWFWWPSDDKPRDALGEFEHLFYLHLSNLYGALGAQVPAAIATTLVGARAGPESGPVMRPGGG